VEKPIDLKTIIREEEEALRRRGAEILTAEKLLDDLDAAIASEDYVTAGKCASDAIAAYAAVKHTSGLEAARNLVLAEFVLQVCDLQKQKVN
jgi:hypothetical protein